MGSFYTGCKVENHKDPKKSAVVPHLLVGTGSEFTWVEGDVLERIGVESLDPRKKKLVAAGPIVAATAIRKASKRMTARTAVRSPAKKRAQRI